LEITSHLKFNLSSFIARRYEIAGNRFFREAFDWVRQLAAALNSKLNYLNSAISIKAAASCRTPRMLRITI
jgi:hypothetical protein